MFQHFRLTLTSLFILLFILPACDYVDDGPTSTEPKRVAYTLPVLDIQGTASSDGITITFEKTADWDAGNGDRGFTAKITIFNETGNTLDDWDLNFDFLAEITSMWNASYTQVDNTFAILPANWNSSIDDGTSRDFGFNGVYSGVFQEPTVYVLSGIPVGDQTLPTPIIPVCTLNTVFNVTSHWSTGSDTYGFVANMHLTNVGAEAVNWELDFDLAADIGNMWNASFQNEGDHYVVTPDSWNVRIEPNQTRSFGFQGSYAGSLQPEPQNIVCNKDDVVESQLEIVSQHILADVAELGQVNVSQGSRDHWHSITTLQTYVDPVVIMQPLSYNDPDPATVRLRQIGPQGFEFQIQEWDYLDGIHPLETVNYFMVEKGLHVLASRGVINDFIIEAGTVEANNQYENVLLTWTVVDIASPIILSQTQTINNPVPVTVRQKLEYVRGNEQGLPRKVGFKVQEQEVNAQAHSTETIGYVILQEGNGRMTTTTNYTNYYFANSSDGVDHNWHGLTFPASLANLPNIEPAPTFVSQTPYFFANMQSTNEDDSSTLRYRQLNIEGTEVLVEEEQSQDSEIEHATEVVGFAAFMGIQPAIGQDTPVAIAHQHLIKNGVNDSLIYRVGEGEYEGQEVWGIYAHRSYVPMQFYEDGSVTGGPALGGEITMIIAKDTGEVLKRTHYQ